MFLASMSVRAVYGNSRTDTNYSCTCPEAQRKEKIPCVIWIKLNGGKAATVIHEVNISNFQHG